jgi:hypothetical protein
VKKSNKQTLATVGYHPRLALVFDFDETLSHSTIDALLRHCGITDTQRFRKERMEPLYADWDDILANFYTLVQLSRDPNHPSITRDFLEEVGRGLELFPGVEELFDRVRTWAQDAMPAVEVEFYVLSCGMVQMHRAHPIAEQFEGMWGSEFHFDDAGEIDFVKQMITFPEKVYYLLQLSKGLGTEGPNEPADVYREVPPEEIHIPLSQILYIGDGASDMPAFQLMNENGGIALGVVSGDRITGWGGYKEMRRERRVQNLAPADYSEGSELLRSIQFGVESICKLIALRSLGESE